MASGGPAPPAHPIGSRSSLHRAPSRAHSGDAWDMYIAEMSSWLEYECARNRIVLDSTPRARLARFEQNASAQ